MGSGGNRGLFFFLGFSNPPSNPQDPHSTREKQETKRGLRYQLLYYSEGTSPGDQPQGSIALLFVNVFMGCQAHLYHQ